MKLFKQEQDVDWSRYIRATYFLKSETSTLKDAAWALAVGQSIGNPNIRNEWETEEMFENHSCLIVSELTEQELTKHRQGFVTIAFPATNIDFATDGISHLLCNLMGGQLDIDIISQCQLIDLEFPSSVLSQFKGPKFGVDGIRKFTGVYDKPLVGGIIKPKTGMSPTILLEMTKQLVEGGANFIKEDEILSSPPFCRLEDRVPLISEYVKDKSVVYAFAINADPAHILDRVKLVHRLGGNAVHVNFWSGLGVYKSIRDLDLPLFLHFQKSGDKILTNNKHDFYIEWDVICKIASLMGVDFIHAGMWGGYKSDDITSLKKTMDMLVTGGTMPALSCGMHPGLVQACVDRFGVNFLANCGGSVHGHANGSKAGMRAMVQAANKETTGLEYQRAVTQWGLVK